MQRMGMEHNGRPEREDAVSCLAPGGARSKESQGWGAASANALDPAQQCSTLLATPTHGSGRPDVAAWGVVSRRNCGAVCGLDGTLMVRRWIGTTRARKWDVRGRSRPTEPTGLCGFGPSSPTPLGACLGRAVKGATAGKAV